MNTSLFRPSRATLCAAALAIASLSFSQETLTNSPAWNGLDYVAPFGEPDIATLGQTFTVGGVNTFMDGFTFLLRSDSGGNVNFRGYVSGWDGSKLTGALLFSSSLQTLPSGTNSFQPFVFYTGHLSLTAGAQYVTFLSTSNDFDLVGGTARVASPVWSDSYSGGDLVLALNEDDFAALSDAPWEEIIGLDLAFAMDFSGAGAVPEPSAWGLIGATALLGLAACRSVQKRAG